MGLHLTGPPPPPPRWHHKARNRISPAPASPPATSAAFSAASSGVPRCSQNTAAGGGEAGTPPQSQKGAMTVPLPTSCQTGGGQGAGRGGRLCGALGLGRVTALGPLQLPPPLPPSPQHTQCQEHRPSGGSRIPALHLKIRADSPSLRCSGPPLHLPTTSAWEARRYSEMAGGDGHLGSNSLAPHGWPFGGKSSALPQHLAPTGLIWSMVMLVASVWLGVLLGV